jgi:hypothetical protein
MPLGLTAYRPNYPALSVCKEQRARPTTRASGHTARRSSLLSAVCFIGVLAARSMVLLYASAGSNGSAPRLRRSGSPPSN